MKLSFAIVASLVAGISASTIAATTASTVKIITDDLARIKNQFARINELLTEFPANGIAGVNHINLHGTKMHDIFLEVISSLNSLPKPIPEADAKKIVDIYTTIAPADISSSNQFAAKEPDFVALSASTAAGVKADLILFDCVCANFVAALQSVTPPDLADTVNTTARSIEAARADAIDAFSSA